jgi:hypothetical protein
MREGGILKDPGVDGRIIFKGNFKRLEKRMDWIDQAQDRDMWRDVVNGVTNIRLP